jgi:hypothetical protein
MHPATPFESPILPPVTGQDAGMQAFDIGVSWTAGKIAGDLLGKVAGRFFGQRFIRPSKVRFTQSSVGASFRNGKSIDTVARMLRGPGGKSLAKGFEPIRLVEKDGLLWTLDNRRLLAFSAGGQKVPFRMATPAEISAEWEIKFTTTIQQGWGQYISVRLPRQ